jgi:adenosylmethionine-8-amino-7-oxononanoate aminotransferase
MSAESGFIPVEIRLPYIWKSSCPKRASWRLFDNRAKTTTPFTMPIDAFVAKSHILHRALAYEPQKIVSGSGISFTLESGKVVLDASAGPSVSVLGHHQPEVTQAIVDQLGQIAYVYSGSRYTCDAAEELADELLKDAPGGLVKAIFVNSGSEATDAALKLATQYFYEIGQRKRVNFIARKQSYHGNTLGALSISGHESRREYYRPWISNNVTFVDPCYAYRAKEAGETDVQYVLKLKQQLEDTFEALGPDTVAAFVAETVSGTTLGCVPPVPGYLKAVREVCDRYGALLILDEVSLPSNTQRSNIDMSRSCVAWERPERCMRGSKMASMDPTSR